MEVQSRHVYDINRFLVLLKQLEYKQQWSTWLINAFQKLRYKMCLLAKYITAVCVLFLMMHAFILPSTKSSLIILDGVSTTRLIGTQSNMSLMDCRY